MVQDQERLKQILSGIILQNVSAAAYDWLEKAKFASNAYQLNNSFVLVPRKTGKGTIELEHGEKENLHIARPGFSVEGWTIDRLSRVWLLLHISSSDKETYLKTIETLFVAAEVNELVALYSALPVLSYPEMWKARCAEGIRNNIGDVLMAIMCKNPYPSENLDEAAWNQMVLKAFFTEKPIDEIIGLDERANEKLAKTLTDYAHERWAAHRDVNPLLWRCIAPFIDHDLMRDIKKVTESSNTLECEAAALAISRSDFQPAQALLDEKLKKEIVEGRLTWNILADKMKENVLQ